MPEQLWPTRDEAVRKGSTEKVIFIQAFALFSPPTLKPAVPRLRCWSVLVPKSQPSLVAAPSSSEHTSLQGWGWEVWNIQIWL